MLHYPVIIAVLGILSAIWRDAFKDYIATRRIKLAILSHLKLELTQTTNTIESILGAVTKSGDSSFFPVILPTGAWQSAIASPHLTSLSNQIINQLLCTYALIDDINRTAYIIQILEYSHPGFREPSTAGSQDERKSYVSNARLLIKQVAISILQIKNMLSKLP